MNSLFVRHTLIVTLISFLALGLLVCLFAQIVIVPGSLAAEAQFDPVIARAYTGLTFIGIIGIACFEAVLVATAMLSLQCWGDKVFSRASIIWMNVLIGACLAAAVVCFFATFVDLVSPELPTGAFPDDADDSTSNALLIFGAAGAAACVTASLVLVVLRDLIKRATGIHSELKQVI